MSRRVKAKNNSPAAETRHLDEAEREGDVETEGSGTDAATGELDSSGSRFSHSKAKSAKNLARHRHRSRPDEPGHNSHPREQLSTSDVDVSGPEAKMGGLEARMDRPSFNSSKSSFERKLNAIFGAYSPRWRSWIIRTMFTLIILVAFFTLIALGPIALTIAMFVCQIGGFLEITRIGHVAYRADRLSWFRTLNWYLFLVGNWFFFGEGFVRRIDTALKSSFPDATTVHGVLEALVTYHSMLTFTFYMLFLILFVLTLRMRYLFKQFTMFAWTHMTILLISTTANFATANLLRGLIWFVVPGIMIVCNDIFAYIAGFFFGRTPLIKLSPKKTVEGYIGGLVATIFFGLIFSWLFCQFEFSTCPVELEELAGAVNASGGGAVAGGADGAGPWARLGSFAYAYLSALYYPLDGCKLNPVFLPTEFTIPHFLQFVGLRRLTTLPFMFHALALALFASLIAPFAGFFASGFKRAFKIKDFSDIIPGHGGLVDRLDCQVLMVMFTYIYYESFIKVTSPVRLLQQVNALRPEQQLEFYELLTRSLQIQGVVSHSSS